MRPVSGASSSLLQAMGVKGKTFEQLQDFRAGVTEIFLSSKEPLAQVKRQGRGLTDSRRMSGHPC